MHDETSLSVKLGLLVLRQGLAKHLRLPSDLQSPCLSLLSAKIVATCHHAYLCKVNFIRHVLGNVGS